MMESPAPQETQNLLQEAFAFHQAGRLEQARALYRKILTLDPREAQAFHLLGVAAFQTGAYEEALRLIGEAIAIDDKVATYHSNRANALRNLGRLEEASAAYRRALDLEPAHADALSNFGGLLNEMKRYEEAEAFCRKALEVAPAHIPARNGLGVALFGLRKIDQAAQIYESLLAEHPNLGKTIVNLGNTRVEQGRLEEAQALYARACALDPANEEAQFSLATIGFTRSPFAAWDEIGDAFLGAFIGSQGVPPLHRLFIGISLSLSAWVKGNFDRMVEQLKTCAWALRELGANNAPEVVSLRAYMIFLAHLYDWTTTHARPSRGDGALEVPIIGDSHSLTYAHSRVSWHEKPCVFEPHLVSGGKAWTMGRTENNAYKAAFAEIIARLEGRGRCILSFGEIDCRAHAGILGHCKKHGEDPLKNATACARDYVRAVVPLLKEKGLTPVFLNVPAPHIEAVRQIHTQLTDEDLKRGIEVVRYFNESLKKEAQALDCEVIDVYSLGAPTYHIDAYHLRPDAFEKALLQGETP